MKIRSIAIAGDVADVLRRSTWINPTILKLPEGQLDRKLYEAVNKVLMALGGKWAKKFGGHAFATDAASDLAKAIDGGSGVDRKKTLEFFETPATVGERMAGMAAAVSDNLDRPVVMLEPSAGQGRLLRAFCPNIELSGRDLVIAIEIDEANCAALREQGIATRVMCADFLDSFAEVDEMADVILMNPPFANNADIAHVRHAAEHWLSNDGILIAVMSPHWVFSTDKPSNDFRVMLSKLRDEDYDWEPLPEGSFRAEGTGVNSGLLTLRKPL